MPNNAIQPVIQKYTVDFAGNNNFLFVKGIQGDGYGTRYVDISLMNNGQPYLIDPNAVTVVIRGTKSDGNVIFNECEILDDNTIRAEITQQMSAVSGKSNYEISVMSNTENKTLTSFPFFIMISKSNFDVGYVVSSDEFRLLVKKINEVQLLKDEVTNIKEESEQAVQNYDIATADLRALEESIKQAEVSRVVAENKRQSDTATAITDATNATNRANAISDDLTQKLHEGYFNGVDGKDGTNGRDGVIMNVQTDQIAFNVVDGNLILTYADGNTTAQNYSINGNGELIYTF